MANLIDDLGLDENEAKVYQALLEIGPSTVSQITKKAGITRTFGYQILEKLSIYGLVNRVSGERVKIRYAAEHPRHLVQFIQNRKNQWERRLKDVEQRLPDLVSLFKVAEKPIIKYQEGIEGVKTIYSQTLESKEEILSILDIEGWDVPEFRQWGREYNRQRSEKKIKERILMLDTPQGRDWMKNYRGSFKYTYCRWIKSEQLPGIKEFGGEINIYENKVVIALLKKTNLMGVMIESTALANILKGLFELAWTQGVEARKSKK
ncbi:MAG: helix-turn-helix domain-containing protein [Patescibacteria group bacterium]